MSRQPEGGTTTPVALEFENIDAAVAKMKMISDTIGSLETKFKAFAASVHPSDWSNEPSCVQFGTSYKAAVSVYADVIAGMKKDLADFSAALQAASADYKKSDANSADALAKLGAVDNSGLAQDDKGQHSYHAKSHHGSLSSHDPERATDTTKNDRTGTTTMPSAPGGGSAASTATSTSTPVPTPANGGAGQSTQPTRSGNVAR